MTLDPRFSAVTHLCTKEKVQYQAKAYRALHADKFPKTDKPKVRAPTIGWPHAPADEAVVARMHFPSQRLSC